MAKRITWPAATVAAALLLAVGAAEASVQERKVVGWLGEGDWQLREYEGEAYFVKSPYKAGEPVTRTTWSVSNPTIKTSGGRMLGYDAKGRDPKPRVVEKAGKGASTRWAFEVVSHIRPGRGGPRLKEGPSGITFRVMAAEGPYKGWYLASKDDKEWRRRLVLVRAKKDATVFKYIEEYYYLR